jgi:RNA polymerase sigma factor (sigma-70 family)
VIRSRRRRVLIGDLQFFEIAESSLTPTVDEATIQRLHNAISKLSPRTVEILLLRYVHAYTEPEIAKQLGRSRGTIAVTLFRSRNRLRKLLGSPSGEKK